MTTHSSILAWRIPWREEPSGLQSIGCKESDRTEWLTLHFIYVYFIMHITQTHYIICYVCYVQMCESKSLSVVSDSLQPHGLYSPWNFPGQNTGVGSLFLLQGILPIQGSNPNIPHCRRILYQLSHKGSPRILDPFSSGSSRPRN